MIRTIQPKLVAITGGSGAGKTWLAGRLQRNLGPKTMRLSLDDFYLDQSHLTRSRRSAVNYDHPQTIDWVCVESALRDCRAGRPVSVPRYNFATHTRLPQQVSWTPESYVLIDGLWLLLLPSIRELFDLSVYLDCPSQLRLERRLARDTAERGRTADSVRGQFWGTVAPMHARFVVPQARCANVILTQPSSEAEITDLAEMIRGLGGDRDSNNLDAPPRPAPAESAMSDAFQRAWSTPSSESSAGTFLTGGPDCGFAGPGQSQSIQN